jgi:ribosome-associated translation inhibitor RaiA
VRAPQIRARPFWETTIVALQITFHGVTHSDAVEAKIRSRADKLSRCCDSIMGCRVAVEAPHVHHEGACEFKVRVEVAVPGEKLVASGKPGQHHAYTDLYLALRHAFDGVRRQLEDYEQRRRRHVRALADEIHA